MPKDNPPTGRPWKKAPVSQAPREPGRLAQAGTHTLTSLTVGCLPILNRLLERMQLAEFFRKHLPPDGPRTRLPTSAALLVLVRNLLMSREPIYGVGDWAAHYAPDLLGLQPRELQCFNDDRLGRSLDRLFVSGEAELVLDVVHHVVKEFGLSLDEIHNDSTTVSFFRTIRRPTRKACSGGGRRRRSPMGTAKTTGPTSSSFYMC